MSVTRYSDVVTFTRYYVQELRNGHWTPVGEGVRFFLPDAAINYANAFPRLLNRERRIVVETTTRDVFAILKADGRMRYV